MSKQPSRRALSRHGGRRSPADPVLADGPTVILRADMNALLIQEATGLMHGRDAGDCASHAMMMMERAAANADDNPGA
ncbi:MAG TPA: hypothetical protein VN541_15310 [Tepidisphaeraceae bacterium]|nr:hypothetical protein [Tepidisphaeraceae bacterium]